MDFLEGRVEANSNVYKPLTMVKEIILFLFPYKCFYPNLDAEIILESSTIYFNESLSNAARYARCRSLLHTL